MENIISEIQALINIPYLAVILFASMLLKKFNINWPFPFVYVVLIEAALVGVIFYLTKDVKVEILVVTYFAATSCYELLIKQLREKLKLMKK